MDDALIRELIYGGYERQNCDFKRSIPWERPGKFSIIKDAMCFANAGGGFIIIGFDEKMTTPEEKRTGVSEVHRKSWETTKVCRDINAYADPPIDVDVREWQDPAEAKQYVVVRIPSHIDTPHLCKRSQNDQHNNVILRSGSLYYRTKNKECKEIDNAHDCRELITHCVLNRKEEMLAEFSQVMDASSRMLRPVASPAFDVYRQMDEYAGSPDASSSTAEQEWVYLESFTRPSTQIDIMDRQNVPEALRAASVSYYVQPLIFLWDHEPRAMRRTDAGIHGRLTEIGSRNLFFYWFFSYSGELYTRRTTIESLRGHPTAFDSKCQVEEIGEIVIAAGRLFHGVGVDLDTEMCLGLRYAPANGLQIRNASDYPLRCFSPEFADSQLTSKAQRKLSDFLNKPEDVAVQLIADLNVTLGYYGSMEPDYFREAVVKHLAKGQRA